jgi:hypothetical protein
MTNHHPVFTTSHKNWANCPFVQNSMGFGLAAWGVREENKRENFVDYPNNAKEKVLIFIQFIFNLSFSPSHSSQPRDKERE